MGSRRAAGRVRRPRPGGTVRRPHLPSREDLELQALVDRRIVLRRRFLDLGFGELAAIGAVTLTLALTWNQYGASPPFTAPILLLNFMLLQGAVYWFAARTWVKRRPMPAGWRTIYRMLRVIDPVLLLLVQGWVLIGPGDLASRVISTLIVLFAVIEYVNYFHVRLSYPIHRWAIEVWQWRPSRLALDLRGASVPE